MRAVESYHFLPPDGKARIVLGISEGDGVAYIVNKFDEVRVLKP